MTTTAEFQSAATSPIEGELARQFLSYEFMRHIHSATILPLEINDNSTKLDICTWEGGNYNRFAYLDPFGMQFSNAQVKAEIIRRALTAADLIVTKNACKLGQVACIYECKTFTGDPAQSIYRLVSIDDQTTDPSHIAPVLEALFGRPKADDPLEGYEQYSQANWDGYGGKPITTETLQYARRLLSVIPETFSPPDIAPSADGSIGLEWLPESGAIHKLFLDIGPGQEWRAYWTSRGGEFGRQAGVSFDPKTKDTLQKLFNDLST